MNHGNLSEEELVSLMSVPLLSEVEERIRSLSRILGHTNIGTTQIYTIKDRKISEDMIAFSDGLSEIGNERSWLP